MILLFLFSLSFCENLEEDLREEPEYHGYEFDHDGFDDNFPHHDDHREARRFNSQDAEIAWKQRKHEIFEKINKLTKKAQEEEEDEDFDNSNLRNEIRKLEMELDKERFMREYKRHGLDFLEKQRRREWDRHQHLRTPQEKSHDDQEEDTDYDHNSDYMNHAEEEQIIETPHEEEDYDDDNDHKTFSKLIIGILIFIICCSIYYLMKKISRRKFRHKKSEELPL